MEHGGGIDGKAQLQAVDRLRRHPLLRLGAAAGQADDDPGQAGGCPVQDDRGRGGGDRSRADRRRGPCPGDGGQCPPHDRPVPGRDPGLYEPVPPGGYLRPGGKKGLRPVPQPI